MNKNHQIQPDVVELIAALKDQLDEDGIVIVDKWAKELESSAADVYKGPEVLYAVVLRVMTEEGLTERIESLDPVKRLQVLKYMYQGIVWPEIIHNHLDVLEIAGYPEFVPVQDRTGQQMNEFQERMMKASNKHFVYSKIDESLHSVLEKITFQGDDNGVWHFITDVEITELLILRSVFGEDALTEVLVRGVDESCGIFQPSAASLIPLLQDWDNLKQYPIEWLLNITENGQSALLEAI